jgi:hypothetical protein
VIDDVVTDTTITTDGCGEFDLRANTIGGGDEHRVVYLLEGGRIEETAERANACKHGLIVCGFDCIFHQLDGTIASIYVNA